MTETPEATAGSSNVTTPEQNEPCYSGRRVLLPFWRAYMEKVSYYQAVIVLAAIYFFVVGPISLLSKLFRHRFLPYRPSNAATFWHEKEISSTPLSELAKQG